MGVSIRLSFINSAIVAWQNSIPTPSASLLKRCLGTPKSHLSYHFNNTRCLNCQRSPACFCSLAEVRTFNPTNKHEFLPSFFLFQDPSNCLCNCCICCYFLYPSFWYKS